LPTTEKDRQNVDFAHPWKSFYGRPCRAPFVLVLVVVVARSMVPVFIYFFQKFLNFCNQVCGLGLISLRLRFAKFLPSVVQPTAHLSWISVMLQAMDEQVFKNEGPLVDL